MYLEKAHVKVIGTKYGNGPSEKDKKGATLSEFKFDDGIQCKDLSKFLEDLQENQHHRFCGMTTCNIVIDTTQE